jgi:threonyl-tRNA synthetase
MSYQNNDYQLSDLYRIRHSAAHVLAQAVLELYPAAKLGIGPPVEDGFYYDFDLGRDENGRPVSFKPDDLAAIEKGMRRIIAGKHPFEYREVRADEARALLADQPYKLELIDGLEAGDMGEHREPGEQVGERPIISTYRQDSFEDLCRGPHVEHTGQIPVQGLKLMSVAGAYWRGDEKRPMLQRIYGTAWHNKKELKEHLRLLEEARQRDHRKIGRELELFMFDEEIGPGLALWMPRGEIIVEELEKLAWEMEAKGGYQRVRTPQIAKDVLYQRSGHLPYYEEDMYPPMEHENVKYYLRPMNCPFHHKIFGNRLRSYKELPMRLAEYGMIYRYEASGQLFGLMRVRGTQQNDAHIYCSEADLEAEFLAVMELYRFYFDLFGVEKYAMRLSKHSKEGLGVKYVDDELRWLEIEGLIRGFMEKSGIPFYEAEGEAAFYGPKIDVQIWSAIGREFSIATNQVDFAAPERFDLKYVDADGDVKYPLCIHRAPLGSHERFIGFLIEHYAGAFPVWLSPEQVRIIPVTDEHHAYAVQLEMELKAAGVRAAADLDSARMGAKIRAAQGWKVPYMLIVGDREVEDGTVSLRRRDGTRVNGLDFGAFVEDVKGKIEGRSEDL